MALHIINLPPKNVKGYQIMQLYGFHINITSPSKINKKPK